MTGASPSPGRLASGGGSRRSCRHPPGSPGRCRIPRTACSPSRMASVTSPAGVPIAVDQLELTIVTDLVDTATPLGPWVRIDLETLHQLGRDGLVRVAGLLEPVRGDLRVLADVDVLPLGL